LNAVNKHNGIKNVVNNTKNNEIPSIPNKTIKQLNDFKILLKAPTKKVG